MGPKSWITPFLWVLCIFSVQGIDHHKRRNRDVVSGVTVGKCDFSGLETRLQHLEANLEEKTNLLRREIRTTSDKITTSKTVLDEVRNEIRTNPDRHRRNYEIQTRQGDQGSQLEREVQVAIAALRLLTSDIAILRQNLSELVNTTNAIRDQVEVSSSIQQVFDPPSRVGASGAAQNIPANCLEIRQTNAATASSVFLVKPKTSENPFLAYCDMDEQDGGWLTIHNRFLGEQDFYRDWQDYKVGFGNIAGDHWLGLERIYEMTGKEIHELLVQLVDVNNVKTFAHYSHFSIGSEEEGYSIKVLGGFTGTAGDSLSYHAGSKFSTKDKDQDSWAEGNCAQSHGGAWWYKSCDKSNLNGRYLPGEQPDLLVYQPMYWGSFNGPQAGLKFARMLIRPRRELGGTVNLR